MSIRFAVHGAAGRMGRAIVEVLREDPEAELVSAIEHAGSAALGIDAGILAGGGALGVKLNSELDASLEGVDVLIDFSLPAASAALFDACALRGVPVVTGTTGLDEGGEAALARLTAAVPVVAAPNFSQGVTALFHLAAEAAAMMGPAFDAEVVEMHHRRKVDAPSGTAVRLAEVVANAKGWSLEKVENHGRSGQVGARPDDEVGVMTLRGGDVVGEHTLFLVGMGERIELTHRATDRAIFARGAVRAGHWARSQNPGRYDMSDVMGIAG